ncbi:fimbria/pilus periplasmic chaperone [Serratia proteamaculans]|uniref:Fimbria/pilus periplasmic chaperone n=1 Tax=Serratia proteamaculans TaxID=28151 RepID=A0A5Q2V562_SERPR|nr:fimbria/pilus periplasmic chaperone [Serratia proteamaculans]QGH60612.1 fimbria/pilus periplasmic chaperone [Serratia proteamaculans]
MKNNIVHSMLLMLVFCLGCQGVHAGGVALGSTRVVYPAKDKQTSLSVLNTDENTLYLLQSWLEDADSKKSAALVITPPLVVIKPKQENTLRIFSTGAALPVDRESLFWINVKAVPSVNKNEQRNVLQLAIVNRIKLFWRPADLQMKPAEAPTHLRFQWQGDGVRITNPTPYYLTLVDLQIGGRKLPNTMVPPQGSEQVSLRGAKGAIRFSTLNDYGATTAVQTGVMQ